MRNQHPSLPTAINNKADRRLDVLVKQQTREHQHLIDAHNKEMQTMRDELKLALEKFQSLFEKTHEDLKDFKTYSVCHLGMLKDRILSQETVIAEQKKSIEGLHGKLLDFQESHSTRHDMDMLKKSFEGQMHDMTVNHLVALQDCQRELKVLISSLKEDLNRLRCDTEISAAKLNEKFDVNFSLSHLEKQGVLKEIRIYEKSMVIIEKKIENIYTLIERINKKIMRGDSLCPKPE
jgi:hypothetical protein